MDYDQMIANVAGAYERDFAQAYSAPGRGNKGVLLRYFFSFYRKWYTSAMIDNTYLTPCNVFALINKEYHKNVLTTTIPTLNSFKRFSKFGFRQISYSLDDHPVVSDLRLFVDSCLPSFELGDGFSVSLEQEGALLQRISLQDPFYIAYLHRLAWKMKLVEDMLSIHSSTARPTKKCESFFALPPREIFQNIVEASIYIAHNSLERFLTMTGILDVRYLTQMLKKPSSSDEVFAHIYGRLGFDFEEIANIDLSQPVSDEMQELASGTFSLGVLLSQHFFTVFGTYLRLINPVYIYSQHMEQDMAYVREVSRVEHDSFEVEIPLFAPCTFFSPTELAVDYFGLGSDVVMELPKSPNLQQLMEIVSNIEEFRENSSILSVGDDDEDNLPGFAAYLQVIELKVALKDDTRFWKRIEFLSNTTLDEVAVAVCYEMFGSDTYDYSFYGDKEASSFNEYVPHSHARQNKYKKREGLRRGNNSETTDLYEFFRATLEASEGAFMLIIRDCEMPRGMERILGNKIKRPLRVLISISRVKDVRPEGEFPRTTSTGKAFRILDFG